MNDSPRVVLVTGCSSGGIGYSLCEEFARKGCVVYATSRNVDKIADFKSGLVHKLALDVNSDESVAEVVKHIVDTEGKIDLLVNNAGITSPGPLIDQPLNSVKEVYETNVFAVLRVSKAVVPIMAKHGSGTIINIGSITGETPTPWSGLYSSSKAACTSISEVLFMELKPFGISVMHISPGGIKSHIADNGLARMQVAPDTLYTDYIPFIFKRIQSSQDSASMPSEVFASRVVAKALSKRPPRYITLGGNSGLFTLFKWLPRGLVLYFLFRSFSPRK
ncbi:oxidoreductase [Pholiota conissans]|uniref:Oxidoreductase n=1 Tax=Pholiota conissans TaxID=109636 RepID=A0A9P5YXF4_9AGAR|nr:oxidoreductase [Pholiota conissans]